MARKYKKTKHKRKSLKHRKIYSKKKRGGANEVDANKVDANEVDVYNIDVFLQKPLDKRMTIPHIRMTHECNESTSECISREMIYGIKNVETDLSNIRKPDSAPKQEVERRRIVVQRKQYPEKKQESQ